MTYQPNSLSASGVIPCGSIPAFVVIPGTEGSIVPKPARKDHGVTPGRAIPTRVQLSRKKGWRLPPNTVVVSRPSKWGNPYSVDVYGRDGAVDAYRVAVPWLPGCAKLDELRGKNLACWCKLSDKCHADVLLELANA